MLFKRYHIFPMFNGIKTYTRRMWKNPIVRIGRSYPVTHKMYYQPEDIVGEIYIEDLYRQPLGMMTEVDAYNEGGYTIPAYREVLGDINDNNRGVYKPLLTTTVLWVVKFRFTLSDIIDGNGGCDEMLLYRKEWDEHMKKYMGETWTLKKPDSVSSD